MKSIKLCLCGMFALVALLSSGSVFAQLTIPATSQEAEVTQRVGITDITIHYNRPYTRNREIWGALVPYGFNDLGFGTSKSAPWRAGADYNTTIEFTHDVKIEGKDIAAGKYGLFMAVEENGDVWVILSHNTTSWGSFFYDEAEDALRVKVTSRDIEQHREILTYEFNEVTPNSTTATLHWAKKEIPFKIDVDVQNIVLEGIKNDLRNPNGFQQSTWDQAANYAFNAGDMDLALEWTNASISGQFFSQETFANLSLKSRILARQGNTEESLAFLDKAIELGNANQVYGAGTQLIASGNVDKAVEVMKNNVKKNKGAWPSNYGLARAYSAKGDFKKAIKSMDKALENAPDRFVGRLTTELERLKNDEDITQQ